MTNTPNITPVNPEGDEELPVVPQAARPAAEKPTPSQQGQFLGALEKKDQKKASGKAASTNVPGAASDTGESVFRLAKPRKTTSFAESSAGEEMGGEAPPKRIPGKKPASASPDIASAQIAAAQAQGQAPATPITGKSQQKISASASTVGAGSTERSTAPETDVSIEQDMAPEEGVVPQRGTGPWISAAPLMGTDTNIGIGPQKSVASEAGVGPQRSVAPRMGVGPQRGVAPEAGVGPQGSVAPRMGVGPQESVAPRMGVGPQRGVVPQGAVAPEAGVVPQKGVTPPSKEGEAFGKLMGEGRKKGGEPSPELVEGTVLPKPVVTPSLVAEAPRTADPQRTQRLAIMEVIRQSVDALATFVSKQETSTVVTIRQPPMFEGATLTVTEYSSAPRQFNITFGNLSPEAQRMVGSIANQQQLKQALVERGYTIQNVFIEATPEAIAPPSAGAAPQGGQAPSDFGPGGQTAGQSGGTGGETGGAE